jgi:hypothetical protein
MSPRVVPLISDPGAKSPLVHEIWLAATYNLSILDILTGVIADEWHYDAGIPVLILDITDVSC